MATPVFFDDFSSGAYTTKWTAAVGTVTITTAAGFDGSGTLRAARPAVNYGARAVADGTDDYLIHATLGTFTLFHAKLRYKLPPMAACPSAQYASPLYFAGTGQVKIYIRKNAGNYWEGYLESFGGNSTAYQRLYTWTDGGWNWIELLAGNTASGVTSRVDINGTTAINATATGATNVTTIMVGNNSPINWSENIDFDEFQFYTEDTGHYDYFSQIITSAARRSGVSTGVRKPLGSGGKGVL